MIGPNFRPGDSIPELVKQPTRRQLVQYAGASGDFYEMHYDDEFARSIGLSGVINHGLLKAAFLAQLVISWAGSNAALVELRVRYQTVDFPDRSLLCRGVVTAVESTRVNLEIWTEDPDGQRTTTGTAVLELS